MRNRSLDTDLVADAAALAAALGEPAAPPPPTERLAHRVVLNALLGPRLCREGQRDRAA